MEQVIADKSLLTTKTFIQNHIESSVLTDEVRTKFGELYQTLTAQNAEAIHKEVSNMYEVALKHRNVALNKECYKFCGVIILGGSCLVAGSYLLKKCNVIASDNDSIVNNGLILMGIGLFGIICTI